MGSKILCFFVALSVLGSVMTSPMMYKKNDKDIYEAGWYLLFNYFF